MTGTPHPDALGSAALLEAIRDRLADQLAEATITPRLGDRTASTGRHRQIEILSLRSDPTGDTFPGQARVGAERTITLRWWLSYL